MRIAVFAREREERYIISRLAEEALLKLGVMSEVAMFPVLGELTEALAY